MQHALDTKKTQSWRSRSPALKAMTDSDRNRRWVSLCGDRLVTPKSAPAGVPTCRECREALGLPALMVACGECNGSGEARDLSGICPECRGEGEVVR